MSTGLYSGVSGLAIGVGLYKGVSGLWSGASGLVTGYGSGGAFDGASLYLNFATMSAATFDPRITFSRGTAATLTDSTGRITYAPNNLLLRSQEFDNATWASSNTPIRTSGQTDPNGGTTATKLDLDVNDGIYQFVGSVTGNFVFSIWVRGDAAGTIRLSDASGGVFDVVVNVTTAWTRVSTGSRAISGFFSPYIYRGSGDLSTVYVAFAQLEQVTYQTAPSAYYPTTTAAYYGPRFDYNPVTRAPKGLLIEEQRTNLLTYSQQFDNASWTKLNATITANNAAAPDGTMTADLVVSTGGETRVGVNPGIVAANTTYTASIFGKFSNANGRYLWFRDFYAGRSVGFDLQTGTVTQADSGITGTVSVLNDGYFRCVATWTTPASPVVANQQYWVQSASGTSVAGGTVGGQCLIWGAQLEAGAFATSYIPTVASQVTRSADIATMTGTNFSGWYNQSAGTLAAEFSTVMGTSPTGVVFGGGSQVLQARVDGGLARSSIRGVIDLISSTGPSVSMPGTNKVAYAYQSGSNAISANGGAAVTSAVTFTSSGGTLAALGSDGLTNNNYLNGNILQIVYFPTRLSDAQLQTLTSPPLVTTLALDFINGIYEA